MMNQVLAGLGVILAVIVVASVAWAANNFEKWTGIKLSAQQQQFINDAAAAIANALKVLLAQGAVGVHDLQPDNPAVRQVAAAHTTTAVGQALADRGEGRADLIHRALSLMGADHQVLMAISKTVTPKPTKGETR